jgi:hypothetical protein
MSYSRSCRVWIALACVMMLAGVNGCFSAAKEAAKMGFNLMKKSNLRITLDDQEGKLKTLKKAVEGQSEWKVEEPVVTSPTFSFSFVEPDKVGRITLTTIHLYQEFGSGYSSQPEFTIVPIDNESKNLLQPDTDYNLGKLPANLKVIDVRNNTVDAVKLAPNVKYRLMLTIRADRGETALVEFKTEE